MLYTSKAAPASFPDATTIVPTMIENFNRMKNNEALKDEVDLQKGY